MSSQGSIPIEKFSKGFAIGSISAREFDTIGWARVDYAPPHPTSSRRNQISRKIRNLKSSLFWYEAALRHNKRQDAYIAEKRIERVAPWRSARVAAAKAKALAATKVVPGIISGGNLPESLSEDEDSVTVIIDAECADNTAFVKTVGRHTNLDNTSTVASTCPVEELPPPREKGKGRIPEEVALNAASREMSGVGLTIRKVRVPDSAFVDIIADLGQNTLDKIWVEIADFLYDRYTEGVEECITEEMINLIRDEGPEWFIEPD